MAEVFLGGGLDSRLDLVIQQGDNRPWLLCADCRALLYSGVMFSCTS